MPIRMNCENCQAKLAIPDQYAGRRGKCPKCGWPIDVPAASKPPEHVTPAGPNFDDLDPARPFDDDELQPAPPPATPTADDRRPCPACGEMIMRNAIKCRFCNEIFDPELKKRERKARGYDEDEDLSTGEWVVAILCSGIGCIIGLVWMIQGKPKGKKMLLVSLAVQGIWMVVNLLIAAAGGDF